MTFPNDYAGVHAALTAGKHVNSSSPLGSRYRELAETMVGKKPNWRNASAGSWTC